MTLYQVNDNFVFQRKAVATRIIEDGAYPTQISVKLADYEVRANSHTSRVFNFQDGVVELKTGQSNISPNKGGHVQLVDLKNGICTCQKP